MQYSLTERAGVFRSAASPSLETPLTDDSLPLQRVYRWEKERASEIFLTQPIGGRVREWRWAQAVHEARCMAAWLAARNWPPGSRIAILSKNCAWWLMAELSIWMSGHVSVPIYPSLSAHAVRALLDHCEPAACFIGAVEDTHMMDEGIPPGVQVIGFPNTAGPAALAWETIVRETPPLSGKPVRAAGDLATIIYTSGTTGTPKGVMHRFAAFSHFVAAAIRVVGDRRNQRVLSYLPLAHIAERALVEATALNLGFHIFFVESVDTFRADLQRARPTIFFSVPRLFAKFQQGVVTRIPQERLDRLLRIPLASKLVRRKILREMGLDSVRLSASGGAALPLGTLEWFRNIGLNLVEGYGMTETGITHTPQGGRSKPGYVGNGVPGVETRIAGDGEVLVRSPMNMIGYYKDPEGTARAFTGDGFFRTGDLGELDAEGWLKIIGRVKEQFKTSKGKYVSPTKIEKLLGEHPAIDGCCVMGAGMSRAFSICLLSREAQKAVADPAMKAAYEESLREHLDRVNAQLEAHEKLDFMVVTGEPWTVGNGFLTPTLKLKRNVVEESYARFFREWDRHGSPIVWHEP